MNTVIDWFAGGEHYSYHTLIHCMDNDMVSIALVIMLCLGVMSGYLIIAYRWSKAAAQVPESDAKKGLNDLKWIFLLCAVCGYLWVILEAFWPAWRLYILFLAALNFVTWRYVIRENSLDRIYKYLKDRDDLVQEIEAKQKEIERLQRAKF